MNWIIDLDGTLVDQDQIAPGAGEFLDFLRAAGQKFLIMTNSVKSPSQIRQKLASLGMDVEKDCILNPIVAINRHLENLGITRAFMVGTDLEISQVKAIQSTEDPQVLIFLDFERMNADYALLQKLLGWLEDGIPGVSASGSPFYKKDGRKQLDTGAFVKLLESASGKSIPTLGKPSGEYFRIASELLGSPNLIVVGDDVTTDIAGARALGLGTVLMKSGKYRPGDEEVCPPNRVEDFKTLLAWVKDGL